MIRDYDDWAVNGSWHKCVCGSRWSDSDGGPCHETCPQCGDYLCVEDFDGHEFCPACQAKQDAYDIEAIYFWQPKMVVGRGRVEVVRSIPICERHMQAMDIGDANIEAVGLNEYFPCELCGEERKEKL